MVEKGIEALTARDQADLGSLEADIWRREREVRASRKAGRTLAGIQAAIVALSVISSGAAGVALATDRVRAQPVSLFNPGADLAPSSLLFGRRP